MRRTVQPEFLDLLPEDHPVARANRRDLVFFNRIMGNETWIHRALAPALRRGDRVLEIGAGDGRLRRFLAPLLDAHGASMDGLDVRSRPAEWPPDATWIQERIQDFDRFGGYDILLAALILHQLHDDELGALGANLGGRCRLILATEPARRSRFLWPIGAAGLLGIRPPSRHDARVSIAAGFRNDEIARLLKLPSSCWAWHVEEGRLGSHRFTARRR